MVDKNTTDFHNSSMIHKSSIDAKHVPQISSLLQEEPEPSARAEAKEVLDFYLKNFPEVQIVRCKKCKSDLCLEVLEPQAFDKYIVSHHQGYRRIELSGSPLLSSRKRLDGAMGYRCKCGNNTINSSIELGLIPSVKNPTGPAMIPSVEPHHEAMVRLEIAKRNYKPDVEVIGNKTRIETFTVERLKG